MKFLGSVIFLTVVLTLANPVWSTVGKTCTDNNGCTATEEECKDLGAGNNICKCASSATSCVDPCTNKCKNNGVCSYTADATPKGKCACTGGYGGLTCEDAPLCTVDNDCNGHGKCTIVAGTQSVCTCNPDWEGDKCAAAKSPETTTLSKAKSPETTTPSKGTGLSEAGGLGIMLILSILVKIFV